MVLLDPSIVEFLTQKQKKSEEQTNDSIIVEQCDDNDVDEGFDSYFVEESHDGDNRGPSLIPGSNDSSMDVANNVLGSNISEKWLHMDHVEHDKLEWMKKIPNARTSRVNFLLFSYVWVQYCSLTRILSYQLHNLIAIP